MDRLQPSLQYLKDIYYVGKHFGLTILSFNTEAC